jgi:hypothetical protein
VVARVTDMRGIDLNVFRFNYDLTMAVLLMHPDGTIYSTYAGRDFTDAGSHQSTTSLARTLDTAYEVHRKHEPKNRERKPPLRVESLDWWKNNKKAQKRECFHCHQVHDAWQNAGRAKNKWSERDQFSWPDPVQVGWRLDRENQTLLTEADAPFRKGDRVVSVGDVETISFGDIQRGLHEAPWGANRLAVQVMRDGRPLRLELALESGWKKPTPEVYAWRPMKWAMSPKPGFGGPSLDAAQKENLGLAKDTWAFRVGYMVTWGPNAKTGHHAHRAGIRMKMVVYEVDGKSDFTGMDHFHAWFRMTRKPGRDVSFKVIQNGTRRTVRFAPLP